MRRLALVGLAIGSIGVVAACTPIKPPTPEPEVIEVPFEFVAPDGGSVTWDVPLGVDEITITAFGAAGGIGAGLAVDVPPATSGTGGTGGLGGEAMAPIAVTPSETLQINVGGRGENGDPFTAGDTPGGFNGGGAGDGFDCAGPDNAVHVDGGGGGGASDVRRGAFGFADRLVVAGGGGGGGSPFAYASDAGIELLTDGGSGGGGGGLDGFGGGGATPGGGGTQAGGGQPGSFGQPPGAAGFGGFGIGGAACPEVAAGRSGGGGGGGLFGGGGGGVLNIPNPPLQNDVGGGGGGGGSGFPADAEFQTGVNDGHGQVVISYVEP